jgi:hypothetical protein
MRSIKVTSKVRLSAVALSIIGIYYGNSLDRDDTAMIQPLAIIRLSVTAQQSKI